MKSNELTKEPLGSNQKLNKFLEGIGEVQKRDQTKKLTIIYAKSKLEVQIPSHWSINKVKCMISTHFKMLNFQKFEFKCNGFLISGKTLVANLSDDQLIVTQAQCHKSFQKYYKQNMRKVIKRYQINTDSPLYPITHRSFCIPMNSDIPKQRQTNFREIPAHRLRRENQQEGVRVINIIRLIGIVALSNLIFSLASLTQIAILIGIALIYFIMDNYVNQNQRRRRQRQREQRQQRNQDRQQQRNQIRGVQQPNQRPAQQVNQNKANSDQNQKQLKMEQEKEKQLKRLEEEINNEQHIKLQQELMPIDEQKKRNTTQAKFILCLAFAAQSLYCFMLSIFPNWTVETHLHANQQKMDKIMDTVKELDPQVSELIKNWKKLEKNERKQQIPNQQ